jgi:energy-coupling factor transporter ATP-binding protein EcfA2
MDNLVSITTTMFSEYKALEDYTLRLSHINILVGPNNCGKSTVLGAYRVLMQGLRRARSNRAEFLRGPAGRRPGWRLPDEAMPISSENIHTDYAKIDTRATFRLSNRGQPTLFFPKEGGCYLFADSVERPISSSQELKRELPLSLVVIPVLGPLEHQEPFVTKDTVRRNLITTRASRNFRNYWYQYPDGFDNFAELVRRTWPGMEIQSPERLDDVVGMFCLEKRISRELYWAGFGFQIWFQLLTHILRSYQASLIVVDEPELYLHPDVQRQLLGILRDTGPDVLIATHSTEIMSEADPS